MNLIFFKNTGFLGQCKREHEVFKEGIIEKSDFRSGFTLTEYAKVKFPKLSS